MKSLINSLRNNNSTIRWIQILSIVLLCFGITWMEKTSFNNPDFSDLVWLCAILVLFFAIRSGFIKHNSFVAFRWYANGTLLWIVWRFLQWIFASRAGWIYGFIELLLFQFQQIIPKKSTTGDVIMWGLTVIAVVLTLLGNYWLFRNFKTEWLRQGTLVWYLFLVLLVGIAIYSNQQHVQENCFGVNAISESLSCRLGSNMGVIGSVWTSLTFVMCILGIGWVIGQPNRFVAQLWLVALQPTLIAIFFNPTRILGVVLFKVIRQSLDQDLIAPLLQSMFFINVIPIVVFLGIIPVCLFLLKSEKLRFWWIISLATIAYVIMLDMMFQTLDLTKAVFTYSTNDQFVFVLMALVSYLPLIIINLIPQVGETIS